MDNPKFMIIGLGSMGKRRVRNLQYLGFKDIIAFEPKQERRKDTEEKYGIQTFPTFESAIAENPDAIIISTPPNFHTKYMKKAAEVGKHFFVEASVMNDGLDEVNEIAKKKGIIAAPSSTMRFKQSIRKLKELLDSGVIGKPLAFTYHMGQYLPDWHPWEDISKFYVGKRETGAGREMVCFESVWLTWLFGKLDKLVCMRGKLSNLKVDIDDAYAMIYHFEKGILGTVLIEVVSRAPTRALHIMGSEGNILWNWNTSTVKWYEAKDKKWHEFKEEEKVAQPGYWAKDDMYIEEMKAFTSAVMGRGEYLYSLDDDIRILNLLLGAEKSSDEEKHMSV